MMLMFSHLLQPPSSLRGGINRALQTKLGPKYTSQLVRRIIGLDHATEIHGE